VRVSSWSDFQYFYSLDAGWQPTVLYCLPRELLSGLKRFSEKGESSVSKVTKIWLVAAASLILIGCILFGGVMIMPEGDFIKLATNKYETIIIR